MFSQILINGLIAGSIYSLVTIGFSLVYSICKFANFVHGAIVVFGGYFLYLFFNIFGLNFWLAVILAIILTVFLGWLVDKIIYKKLRQRKSSTVVLLIASIALLILFESLILMFFGPDVKSIGYIKIDKGKYFLGAIITPLQILIILISLIFLIFFYFFMRKTKIGKAMRAVADNKEVAEIVGISSEKIYSYSFIISSIIAAISGILVSLEQNLEPTMGTYLIIKGFASAVIGGVGNVFGGILGAFFLGLVENFGIYFLPSSYKDAIAFIILFLFLLFRPRGILGVKKFFK